MQSVTITYSLIWSIKGHDSYMVTACGKVFNVARGRQLKRTVNGGQVGYWIAGKWHSLAALRPLLYKRKDFSLPF